MKRNVLSFVAILLSVVIVMPSVSAFAKSSGKSKDIYKYMYMEFNYDAFTIYTGNECYTTPSIQWRYSNYDAYTYDEYSKAWEVIEDELVWSVEDSSIVSIVNNYTTIEDGSLVPNLVGSLSYKECLSPVLLGLTKGKTKLTISSKTLGQSVSLDVTVKDTELLCSNDVYYKGNSYVFKMAGSVTGTSFASSDKKVATIDEHTGMMTAKKAGSATITCVADNGKTYKRKVMVEKPGLNYNKITSYYFTGMTKGYYSQFPIVAKGLTIKSWKTSNSKVAKVSGMGPGKKIGCIEIHGVGKCNITATDKNGKKYTCKVTIVGGKPWSGLNGGYRPTIEEVKKHGYYDDINKIQDYGDVIFSIFDYAKEVNYKNGNKKLDTEAFEKSMWATFAKRYPGVWPNSFPSGDLLGFTQGSKYARLWCGCYYIE